MVRSMWLFKHKFHADGTLSRYEACLVANGSSQKLGVDFDEMFSPVLNRLPFARSLALLCLPPGFVDNRYPHQVCLLQRSLYGLKQAPCAWFQWSAGLFLSQKKYALQLFERAHMVTCNPSRTPVDTKSNMGLEDLSYAVQQIFLYMHDLKEPHLATLKRILRYIQGTLDLGPHLYVSFTTSLVGYTDADWAGCPSTRIVKTEYRGVANVVAETAWLRNLLLTAGKVRVLHVPFRFQYAEIFTKGLPFALFEEFRSSLSIRPPSALTAWAY
ncbi:ribonuclease H-like domain-containing protein [Tanacetum coccineum]